MKRMHKKSRLGCSTCKRRRIKCDEKPPCCGPCRKKGLECEYGDISLTAESFELLTPSDFSKGTPSSHGPSRGSKSGSREPLASSDAGAFTLNDLALMNHWTLVTSRTMGVIDDERYHSIWQSQVPRLAQAYPFLMHALLSTAALHMAIAEPEPPFSGGDRGQCHYSKALGLFSETVTEVDIQNPRLSEAIWCFSVVVMHISFVMGRVNSLSGQDIIESFASVLSSVRSARDVLAPLRTSPPDSLVRDLMEHTRHRPTHSLPTEVSQSLRRIENRMKERSGEFDPQKLALLGEAVASTRYFFTLVSPHPVDWAHILQWPFSLDRNFFSLLLERNPIALSLLAHWCVPVCNAPKRWSVGDWPRIVMGEIHASLEGTPWLDLIEWPEREIVAS